VTQRSQRSTEWEPCMHISRISDISQYCMSVSCNIR
jgi:hypothetical protein